MESETTKEWLPDEKLDGTDANFGANRATIARIAPEMEDIPDEFKNDQNKWAEVANDWFFRGMPGAEWFPKKHIYEHKALRHIASILMAMDISHEHKNASAAYLLSLWFDNVTYQGGRADDGV